jgi:hypothetical protein
MSYKIDTAYCWYLDHSMIVKMYFIDEEVHPCLFPVDLENPEDMPDDEVYYYDEEDLMG